MNDPLAWLDEALADLDQRSLRRVLAERTGPQRGDRIQIEGQSLVNFGSNDYLGLAGDPRIAAAVRAAVDEYGWGSGASPLVTGRSALHAALERKLAEFEGTEAALLFPTGYAANVGAITAIVGKGDAIYSDELNHASLIDGCRLSGAAVHVYRHGDIHHLRELLVQASPGRVRAQTASGKRELPEATQRRFPRRLIITDTLFSMHGDLAPLPQLTAMAGEFDCMLLVDEAHATGVFGAHGRGASEAQDVENGIHVRVGTLSKALGSHGGFVAGSRKLIDWLANRARPYVFSTAAPAALAAAGLAALDIVEREPERRQRLRQLSERLRGQLPREIERASRPVADGLGSPPYGHIVPVVYGDEVHALAAAAELRRQAYFVPAIRPPSVPEGQSLLRISLTCLHTEEQIDNLAAAIVLHSRNRGLR